MRQDIEELPRFENKNYTRTKGGKTLRCDWGPHHFPQERYTKYRATLKGCVGMKWDDVYSKLKHDFKDILDRNYGLSVELNCFTKNGKVYSANGRFRMDESHYSYKYLYVAEDGILRQSKHIKFERKKRKPFFIELNKLMYHKDNFGIWWECTVKSFNAKDVWWSSTERFEDAFYGLSSGQKLYNAYGKCVYTVSRRQSGKRLCKKLNALEKAQ